MRTDRRRGGALLTVLWLAAALTAIAFSIANTVRGETERTSTHVDQTKAYYLAMGAVDRAILWMQWGRNMGPGPDGTPRYWTPGLSRLRFPFPTGGAEVEIIPESSKFNINTATAPDLLRLLSSTGIPPDHAQTIAAAILDWRQPAGGPSEFDQVYLSMTPSFRARHASFEQIEELLFVRGVTPDMFYGTWARNAAGQLVRQAGLRDSLAVHGENAQFDINSASFPVLVALGLSPELAQRVIERRQQRPFLQPAELVDLLTLAGPAAGRLRIGGNSIYTLRATAALRNSDARRSVAAVVKFNIDDKEDMTPFYILRWYDNAGTN